MAFTSSALIAVASPQSLGNYWRSRPLVFSVPSSFLWNIRCVLILGSAFKGNDPGSRNTHVVDIVQGFQSHHARVEIYDPCVSPDKRACEYQIQLVIEQGKGVNETAILVVAHQQFCDMDA